LKQRLFRHWAIRRVAIALLLAMLLLPATGSPALAISPEDYIQISYGAVEFSSTEVHGNETFYATISGEAVCIRDLPLSISEASISSRVIARHHTGAAGEILNPGYTISLKPLPCRKGDSIRISKVIALQFPAESQSGDYDVLAELTEVKARAGMWIDVTQYLPPSQIMGSVSFFASPPQNAASTPSASARQKMHIEDIDMEARSRGFWLFHYSYASGTVTVLDAGGTPVPGALVSCHWTGATSGSDSALTDSLGRVTFVSAELRRPAAGTTFTFVVDDVARTGWTYNPDASIETSDSVSLDSSSLSDLIATISSLGREFIRRVKSLLSQSISAD